MEIESLFSIYTYVSHMCENISIKPLENSSKKKNDRMEICFSFYKKIVRVQEKK